jgi:hypothetical protein
MSTIVGTSSEIIFSMKLRRRVPDYTTSDWVHSLHEGADPRFGEELLYGTKSQLWWKWQYFDSNFIENIISNRRRKK